VRPEEAGDWSDPAPVATVSFAASPDAQAQAVEQAIEQGRRVAARGGDAVVVVDTLEWLPPHAARRALAAARNITDGGSLSVIGTAPTAFGGETTVIALDSQLTALRRFPALDLPGSGTLRADALVGEAGAEAIAKARAEAAAE
jgi:transcription termination factor Rho